MGKQYMSLITAIVLLCTVFSVKVLNFDTAYAAMALKRGTDMQKEVTLRNIADIKEAIARDPYGAKVARGLLAEVALLIAAHPNAGVDKEVARQFFNEAIAELRVQIDRSPLDAHYPLLLGKVYVAYGYPDDAIRALQQAHTLAPNRQDILLLMADIAVARNDAASALQHLKKAFDVREENTEIRLVYATIAVLTENDALADELLKPLIEEGSITDPRIIRAYAARNRIEKIVTIADPAPNVGPGIRGIRGCRIAPAG